MPEPTPIRPRRTRLATSLGIVHSAFTLRWRRFEIVDNSMIPTLEPDDWTIAIVGTRDLRTGDIVVVEMPTRPGFLIVKRIGSIDDEGLWLVADNPAGADSRTFGSVPVESVVGRLALRYHPWPPRLIR